MDRFLVPRAAQELWDEQVIASTLAFQAFLDEIFRRECGYTWHAFFYVPADADTLKSELQWAFNRADVRTRWATGSDSLRLHSPDSPWAFMNPGERIRYAAYLEMGKAEEACDVGADPTMRKLHSKNGKMHTFTAGMGSIVSGPHKRLMLAPELLAAMGFPIEPDHVEACSGARCSFTRGEEGSSLRTHASAAKEAGNAMHANSVGAVHLLVVVLLARLADAQSLRQLPDDQTGTRRRVLSLASASSRAQKHRKW